jgi:hypothetical protein
VEQGRRLGPFADGQDAHWVGCLRCTSREMRCGWRGLGGYGKPRSDQFQADEEIRSDVLVLNDSEQLEAISRDAMVG